MIPRSNEYLG
jgi:hypothetical protein